MEIHPYCDIFPEIAGEEFEAFADDIAANGQKFPILTHRGKIVDGRNRYRACLARGIEPRFEEWKGSEESLLPFVVSANLSRRHLNDNQRAYIASKIKAMFEEEARKRQGTCIKQNKNESLRANWPEGTTGRCRDKAAAIMNASPLSTERYSRASRNAGPELEAEMIQGTVSGRAAEAISRLPKEEQGAAIRAEKDRPKSPPRIPRAGAKPIFNPPDPKPKGTPIMIPIDPPAASHLITRAFDRRLIRELVRLLNAHLDLTSNTTDDAAA